jgi:hypothetical protein
MMDKFPYRFDEGLPLYQHSQRDDEQREADQSAEKYCQP